MPANPIPAAYRTKPRKVLNAGALAYRHDIGFSVLIPLHLQTDGYRKSESTLVLGRVTLTLVHSRRQILGDVPASWLVDLNADSAVVEEVCDA